MKNRALWLAATLLLGAACTASEIDVGPASSSSGQGGASSSSGTAGNSSSGEGGLGDGGEQNTGCGEGPECASGQVCVDGQCLPTCGDGDPCAAGLTCCAGTCVDLATDLNHCGMCGNDCPTPDNMASACENSMCTLGDCDEGYFECDGDSATGCESDKECSCTPATTQPCYPGPAGTENKGPCKAGYQTCNAAGTAWSLCYDFVVPTAEICANNVDEDCNGVSDDVPDIDGDGWTSCDNDCCEVGADCADPKLVNPGAFEFVGNQVDDDCDPASSDANAPPPCSTKADFSGLTAQQLAEAMDLCQTASANDPLPQKKWGVLKADLLRADGSKPSASQLSGMRNWQSAVLVNYGTGGVVPQMGPTMAGISSGRMRDQNDSGYVNPNGGSTYSTSTNPPAVYLAAHGNQLPSSAGCSGNCPSGSGANDAVNLKLTIRVPTNALSFSYRFRFFSSEYWTYSCTQYNDFYLALLDSSAANIPPDHNISFDSKNNPVSVNNGFFDSCVPKGCYSCPSGTGPLAGTGMQVGNTGGGTKWLKTTAPIVPGETMVLELMVFDVSDHVLDSLSLLDAFEWSVQASGVGTGPVG